MTSHGEQEPVGARLSWAKVTTAASAVSALGRGADVVQFDEGDLNPEVEDEVDQLRRFLIGYFGSKQSAFKALDNNGNGSLSMFELRTALQLHHISPQEACGTGDLRKVFKMIDVDGTGEISMLELFETDRATRVEAVRKLALLGFRKAKPKVVEKAVDEGPYVDPKYHDEVDQAVEHLRAFLCTRFGSAKAAFKALDTNGNGDLSMGEITSSLDRNHISAWEVTGGVDLRKVFAELDYNKSMELSFFELMVADWDTRHHVKKPEKARPKKQKEDEEQWVGYVGKRRGAILPGEEDDSVVFDEMCEWMKKIAEFANNDRQFELDLKFGFIGEKGAKMLASAIRKPGRMRQMKVMQLYGNYMTSPGIIAIAESLEKYCSLQRLLLGWNGIDDVGASRLATTLTKITALVELNLSHNRIGNNGAKAIARSLSKKLSLAKLHLENNSIGHQGLERLHKARYQGLTINYENNATGIEGFKGKCKDPTLKEAIGELAGQGGSRRPSKLSATSGTANNNRRASKTPDSAGVPAALSLASLRRSDGDSDAASTCSATPSPPKTPTTTGPVVQNSTADGIAPLEGNWASRVLPRSPAAAAATLAGVCTAWDADVGHMPRRPRTPQRPVSQGSMRPINRAAITEAIGFADPCGKGMVGETWPAAMQLSKALSDAKLLGQGSLQRPASQGGTRRKRTNSFTQIPLQLKH